MTRRSEKDAVTTPDAKRVQRWLASASAQIAAEVIAVTANAPDEIRKAMEHPSQVDLAIVSRLADLLGPRVARLTV
jgi:hypothetical protein